MPGTDGAVEYERKRGVKRVSTAGEAMALTI